MLHLEVPIYAVSFGIFIICAVFYLKKNVSEFLSQKKKNFEDFFSTSHYLQNISLTYIMQEKENDVDAILEKIQQDTKKEIKKMEKKSIEDIQNQIQKLRSEFSYKMKIMNSQFINDTKEKIVGQLMHKVKASF